MRFFRQVRLAVAVAVALAASFLVSAESRAVPYTPVQWTQGEENVVPLENVFAMLRKRYTGDPIGNVVKQTGTAGALLYQVKWLTDDGRKLVFLVDARSGGVVSTRGAN